MFCRKFSKKNDWCLLIQMKYQGNKQIIKITQNAFIKLSQIFKGDPKIKGLSLDVVKSGCLGFSYRMKAIYEVKEFYIIFNIKSNMNFFILPKSIHLINGVTIDYVNEGLNKKFSFKNQKIIHTSCKCGKSFNFK
ncbi:iron-sulfur cluster assembly scaffold protein [Candidatus Riesia pediculicola USDA]|uniref:Iron-sulfur cluster assembly scaffold protein n=2 Tax=Candidatus Riesia pediculicola TaxID=401619 RepID=D4G7U8_RIEPU|nr:iron-sulfur cluster assembly scaffold protein [Candidatus Riesia pediculicola USDA]